MNERVPVTYGTVVTLEVAMINRVETDNRCIQPDVGFSQVGTDEEVFFSVILLLGFEHFLDSIKGLEDAIDGRFIRALRGGKAGTVHSI
jgi:hypothetical protein